MNKRAFLGLAAGTALLVGVATAADAGGVAYGRSRAPAPLEGTWQVTINPFVCSTGQVVPGATIRSMLTFAADGTMLETTSSARFQPGQRSIGMGFWERSGRNSYHAVFEAYVQFTSVVTPPATPAYQRSIQRVDQGIEMQDEDHWTSSATVSFRDESGTPISSGCMSAEGVRLQ
jgi:hypothetical protein